MRRHLLQIYSLFRLFVVISLLGDRLNGMSMDLSDSFGTAEREKN